MCTCSTIQVYLINCHSKMLRCFFKAGKGEYCCKHEARQIRGVHVPCTTQHSKNPFSNRLSSNSLDQWCTNASLTPYKKGSYFEAVYYSLHCSYYYLPNVNSVWVHIVSIFKCHLHSVSEVVNLKLVHWVNLVASNEMSRAFGLVLYWSKMHHF